MNVIGVTGYARSGKDTFASIAKDILSKNGINARQYSFAEQLKKEVAPFLKDCCGVDVWTQDTSLKKDIRDFLVWYGTTFWRKRDPKRWIRGVDSQLKTDGNEVDIAIVSDVRYPNEAEWVHSWSGFLVHISAWKRDGDKQIFQDAPNEQERLNDPLVKEVSNYALSWEDKGLSPNDAISNPEFRQQVLKALNSCHFINGTLHL